jgi:hypothetical protein
MIAMWPVAAGAASQFGPCFEQAKAGRPFADCVQGIDLSKVDLAEETPALLQALNGGDAVLARRAAAVPLGVLMMRSDAKTKRDARALVPAISAHYDDPDPDQPPDYSGPPTDAWRRAVMYVVVDSDAFPPPALLGRIVADLNRKGDANGSTAKLAAGVLLHLRPLPQGLIDTVLAKMDESDQSRVDLIEVLGRDRVDDPRVIEKIESALEVQPPPPAGLAPNEASGADTLRRAAAQALGQIGPPAASALPALRLLAGSADPGIEEATREAARQAIRLIEARR